MLPRSPGDPQPIVPFASTRPVMSTGGSLDCADMTLGVAAPRSATNSAIDARTKAGDGFPHGGDSSGGRRLSTAAAGVGRHVL